MMQKNAVALCRGFFTEFVNNISILVLPVPGRTRTHVLGITAKNDNHRAIRVCFCGVYYRCSRAISPLQSFSLSSAG